MTKVRNLMMKLGYHDDRAYLNCPICGQENSHDGGEPTAEERLIIESRFRSGFVAWALHCESDRHRYLAYLGFHKGYVYAGTTHSSVEIMPQGGIRTNAPDVATFRGLFTRVLSDVKMDHWDLQQLMGNYEAVIADFAHRGKGTTNLLCIGHDTAAGLEPLTRFGPEIKPGQGYFGL